MRKVSLAVAGLALLATAPVAAQEMDEGGFKFGVNAGATLPMGDLGDAVKTGWGGGVTLMMRGPGSKVGWGIDAQFHRLAFEDVLGVDPNATLNAYGAMARLEFTAGNALYLLGGAGRFRQEVTSDDDGPDLGDTNNTDFAVQGGLGFNFGPGLYLEGKFVNIFTEGSNTQMIPLTVGIRF
jgi:opacity protein-like surface antigen